MKPRSEWHQFWINTHTMSTVFFLLSYMIVDPGNLRAASGTVMVTAFVARIFLRLKSRSSLTSE